MNDQDQRANTEKSHKFSAPQTRKKIRPCVKKLSLIVASGLLTLTAYASNTYTIREVQLMLSLSGYNLSYGDSKGIDGKPGQITREAIKDYQAKKHLTPTGNVDKWLYDSLYEDTKSKPPTPPAAEEEKKKDQPASETDNNNKTINALSGELKTIKDGMSDRFISYFYTQSALLASFIALLLIVVTFTATFWINRLIEKIERDNESYRLKILNDAEKKHQEMLKLSEVMLSANLYTTFSAHCIDLYKDFEITNKKHTRQRTLYNSYLKIAKSLSYRGYMAAKKLEQLKPELTDPDRATIASCINNELFYSATAIIDEEDRLDKKEINRLYAELEKIYNDKESIDKTSMMETMTWAKLNAGWYTNLSEIEMIIQPLLNDKRYSYELRKDIFERYKKYRTPQGVNLVLNEPPKDN